MLDNKVIIYDDSCPMCKVYTYWLVAWGFLKPENRIGFATAPADVTDNIDLFRGRHEIPLYDRATRETIYGLDALTYVLGSKWAWLSPFFNSTLFKWMFYPVYQIITYNRRVIAGCKTCGGFDCAPDLNRFYRAVFLLIAFTLTLAVVGGLAIWAPVSAMFANLAISLIVAFTAVGIICGIIVRLNSDANTGWNYAGNYATTILIVALTMIPMLLWRAMPQEMATFNTLMAGILALSELRRRGL